MVKGKRSSKDAGRKPQLADDMYDDVDKFHKDNDLRFETEMDDEDEDLDGEEEEGVMDLDDSDDADSDDDLEAGGHLAKIIAAERAVKQKLVLQKAGADDSDGDSESEEEDDTWGGKKRVYYGDEEVDIDFESDEEAAKEEEEEALRLQKAHAAKLSRAQFGLPEDGSDEENDEDGDEGNAAKASTLGDAAEAVNHVHSETLTQALSEPARAQMRAAVLADAPELLSLLPDLVSSLGEVRHRTAPLLAELRESPELTTKEGLSYLDAKHMLLLMYCMHILFYIVLKLEGQPVKSHPVMQRLVAAKTYLEKLKGIDKRVKHQVDKLLLAAKAARTGVGAAGEDGELVYRANPSALVSKLDEDMQGSGAYRPPKLAAVSMNGPSGGGGAMHAESDEDLLAQAAGTATTNSLELSGRKRAREERSAQRMQRAALQKAQHSQFVKDLQAEVMDAPQEDAAVGSAVARGTDTLALLKQQQRLEARAAIEEDMMIRVALPKEEKKRLRAARRAAQAAGAAVEGFADDVEGVIAQEENGGMRRFTDKLRLGQKFGGALGNDAYTQPGGDAELPTKPALPERRAKYDAVKARQAAQAAHAEAEALASLPPRIEDEFYTETKKRHMEKKKAKEEARRGPAMHPPLPDPHNATAARGVTREIQKNRGLTPHKKKELRNPRKANRVKFASAEKRRKGAVVAVRKSDGPYGGEATGIKSKIVKSVRLG